MRGAPLSSNIVRRLAKLAGTSDKDYRNKREEDINNIDLSQPDPRGVRSQN